MTVEHLHGRMVDLDSHLMVWPDDLARILGPELVAETIEELGDASPFSRILAARLGGDKDAGRGTFDSSSARLEKMRERARSDIWGVKGYSALGAQDAADRLEALDRMGVSHQLVFPTGMWGAMLTENPAGFEAVSRYNDFVLGWASASARLRPACLLNTTDVDKACAEAERVAAKGARLLQLTCAEPPGGISPAAPAWTRLWEVLESEAIPVLYHTGGNTGFVDLRWTTSAAQRLPGGDPDEAMDAFRLATTHMGPEAALTAIILGGVFQRHPGLRFGVIELGASWVPSWMRRLDWAHGVFSRRPSGPKLELKPSEYIRRHVKVTPFYGEPAGRFIEETEAPELFLFSTDYPHPEGGRDPVNRFYADVEPLGPDVVERFFVTNGLELMPA